jgi:channel protein (hemolysin III family)
MRLREPFNAGSHFVGLLLAVAGTWLLLRGAEGWSQMLAFGVYGATLMLLYAASTV